MKKNLLIIFLICLAYDAWSQCTFERFFPYYPAPKNRMLLLKDGGYLSYGTNEKDTINFKLKETDLVMVKTDSCGNIVWINDTGYLADGAPDMWAVEMNSGNIMMVGYTAAGLPSSMGNIRVGKYNKDGQLIKETLLPGSPISAPSGVVKNKIKANSYFVFGNTYNVGSEKSKPLLFELDENLNIIRQKEFQYNEITNWTPLSTGTLSFLSVADSNTYYCMVTIGTVNDGKAYLVELDSMFLVKKAILPHNDSIYNFGFYNIVLNTNKSHFDCIGVYKPTKSDIAKDCFFKMDLEGNIQKIVYFDDTISNIKCMNPTKDGGFILSGSCVFKVDSNCTIEWAKSNRGSGGLFSIEQLPDGGFIGGGICDLHTQSLGFPPYYYEMYLVKMDKDGNYLHTGVQDIAETSAPQLSIYPNPANTLLTIQSTQKYSTIELWNTTGSLVLKDENASTTIDVSLLPQGLYIIRVLGSKQDIIATQKVSVSH